MFKINNKLSPEYINDLVTLETSSYNLRGEKRADIPRVSTTRYGLWLFRSKPPPPRICNSRPNIVCGSRNHTRSSEGCSVAWTLLAMGALCVLPRYFVFLMHSMLIKVIGCVTDVIEILS